MLFYAIDLVKCWVYNSMLKKMLNLVNYKTFLMLLLETSMVKNILSYSKVRVLSKEYSSDFYMLFQ